MRIFNGINEDNICSTSFYLLLLTKFYIRNSVDRFGHVAKSCTKKRANRLICAFHGADTGIRTRDLVLTKEVL